MTIPQRVEKLARIRLAFEQLRAGVALFFADELDISLLPKVGYQWMPKGEQVEVLTPGTNEKRYLAARWISPPAPSPTVCGIASTTGLFLDLLETLDRTYPAPLFSHLTVVADNAKIHQAPGSAEVARRPSPLRAALPADLLSAAPIRLSGPLAMSMTNVPATIPASGCGIWCRMSNSICRSMGRGAMPSPRSTTRRR